MRFTCVICCAPVPGPHPGPVLRLKFHGSTCCVLPPARTDRLARDTKALASRRVVIAQVSVVHRIFHRRFRVLPDQAGRSAHRIAQIDKLGGIAGAKQGMVDNHVPRPPLMQVGLIALTFFIDDVTGD